MQQMYSEQFPFIPPRFQRMCGRLFYIIKRGGGVRSKIFSTQPQPPRIFFLATWLDGVKRKINVEMSNKRKIFTEKYQLFYWRLAYSRILMACFVQVIVIIIIIFKIFIFLK